MRRVIGTEEEWTIQASESSDCHIIIIDTFFLPAKYNHFLPCYFPHEISHQSPESCWGLGAIERRRHQSPDTVEVHHHQCSKFPASVFERTTTMEMEWYEIVHSRYWWNVVQWRRDPSWQVRPVELRQGYTKWLESRRRQDSCDDVTQRQWAAHFVSRYWFVSYIDHSPLVGEVSA